MKNISLFNEGEGVDVILGPFCQSKTVGDMKVSVALACLDDHFTLYFKKPQRVQKWFLKALTDNKGSRKPFAQVNMNIKCLHHFVQLFYT